MDGALVGETDALQIINDFLIHCSGETAERLLQDSAYRVVIYGPQGGPLNNGKYVTSFKTLSFFFEI